MVNPTTAILVLFNKLIDDNANNAKNIKKLKLRTALSLVGVASLFVASKATHWRVNILEDQVHELNKRLEALEGVNNDEA